METRRDFARQASRLLAVLVCAASLVLAAAPVGLANFFQVDEHLYRGAQPSETGVQSLTKLGIKAIIDLRGAGERSTAEQKEAVAAGMKYYSIPMPAFGPPTDEQIATALALINDSENWPVFVHCLRGKDRTGTVIACYRVRHDRWPNQRALKEAREHGLNWVERGMRTFILQYNPNATSPVLGEASK
jgi:tyrosine-protein phosphatase SIW14